MSASPTGRAWKPRARNTSVSRLIGEMLAEKMRHDDAYERSMDEWRQSKPLGKSDGGYPSREETYRRGP